MYSKSFLLTLLCSWWCSINVLGERKAVSLVELAKCKQFQCYGYGYKTYFIVEDLQHMRNETDLLHTRIAILAGRDAHILLSDTNNPSITDNVVEIVLGAGSNTFAEIRRRMGFSSIKSKRIPDILSYVDPMAFEIRVTKRGVIDVRYEGDEEPLIFAEYGNLNVTVQFISFSCWGTSTCKFFYDCPSSLYDQLIESNQTETPLDALEAALFEELDSNTAPYNLKTVEMGMDILSVRFDPMRNVMLTRVTIRFQWEDGKLKWDPENYDNINEMKVPYHLSQHWIPCLKILNGYGNANADTSETGWKHIIHYNGTVEATSKQFEMSTWCAVGETIVWPHEQVKCHLNLSLANALNADLARLLNHEAIVEQSGDSQWKIMSVDMTLFKGQIAYSVTLKRNEAFIGSLFGGPLVFALVMLMASVFIQESMYRLFLVMLSLVMLIATLITLTELIPPMFTPLIVKYYSLSLLFNIFALFCHILAQRMENPPKSNPPKLLLQMSNNRMVNYFLCFVPDAKEYNSLTKSTDPWKIISGTIDRIYILAVAVFLVYIAIRGY